MLEPWEVSFKGKIAVIGLGNLYMKDDAAGLRAAYSLRERKMGDEIFVYETQDMDLSLLWQFREAKKIVILDAVKSGHTPGMVTVLRIGPGQKPVSQLPDLHALQLYDLFDTAADSTFIPCPVVIVGVEPKDCSPGEEITDEVAAALPRMLEIAIQEFSG